MISSNTTSNPEDRLHDIAARLRQEREEAFRKAQVAEQRWQMVQKEFVAAQATHSMIMQQFEADKQEKEQIVRMVQQKRQSIHQMTQEVEFQHSELVYKRQALEQTRKTIDQARTSREASLTTLQHAVSNRRKRTTGHLCEKKDENEKMKENPNSDDCDDPLVSIDGIHASVKLLLLEQYIEADRLANGNCSGESRLTAKWPRLIREKAQDVTKRIQKIQSERVVLERIVSGYKQYLQQLQGEYKPEEGRDSPLSVIPPYNMGQGHTGATTAINGSNEQHASKMVVHDGLSIMTHFEKPAPMKNIATAAFTTGTSPCDITILEPHSHHQAVDQGPDVDQRREGNHLVPSVIAATATAFFGPTALEVVGPNHCGDATMLALDEDEGTGEKLSSALGDRCCDMALVDIACTTSTNCSPENLNGPLDELVLTDIVGTVPIDTTMCLDKENETPSPSMITICCEARFHEGGNVPGTGQQVNLESPTDVTLFNHDTLIPDTSVKKIMTHNSLLVNGCPYEKVHTSDGSTMDGDVDMADAAENNTSEVDLDPDEACDLPIAEQHV